jgi:hypothetical protein
MRMREYEYGVFRGKVCIVLMRYNEIISRERTMLNARRTAQPLLSVRAFTHSTGLPRGRAQPARATNGLGTRRNAQKRESRWVPRGLSTVRQEKFGS